MIPVAINFEPSVATETARPPFCGGIWWERKQIVDRVKRGDWLGGDVQRLGAVKRKERLDSRAKNAEGEAKCMGSYAVRKRDIISDSVNLQ